MEFPRTTLEEHRIGKDTIVTTSLIVVQPTPFCNIDCAYCYLPNRSDRRTIATTDLRQIFKRLFAFPTVRDHVTIVWHAGEPLVLGPEYYEAAFENIRAVCPENLKIAHAIQTNGMLINDAWCDLFKRWEVGIGISIDGPKRIHDAARKTRAGKGTHDKAVAGLRKLQERSIPFYVISVLTKTGLLEPDQLFDFYRALDIRDVGFNIEEKEGIHSVSTLDVQVDGMIESFFARFAQLMEEYRFPIVIRELEETLAAIQALEGESPMSNERIPFGIVTIDVQGDVFTFSPELAGYSSPEFATFSIGNVYKNTFEEMRDSSVLKGMTASINRGVKMCQDRCKYFRVCGGGAPSNKVFENGTFASSETMYCRLTKQHVTDFVLRTIEARFGPRAAS